MKTANFDYVLPEELIAQEPAPVRDECRLLTMERTSGKLTDCIFRDIVEYLRPNDLLIANETRVLPARLLGKKRGTGGNAEVFLLKEVTKDPAEHTAEGATPNTAESNTDTSTENTPRDTPQNTPRSTPEPSHNLDHPLPTRPVSGACALWEVLVKPGRRLKAGAQVDFFDSNNTIVLSAEIIDFIERAGEDNKGQRLARLTTPFASVNEALHVVGKTPLPPYIKNYTGNMELYQTVFSQREGSAAAPTAGLHFTPQLIERIKARGTRWATVELEVGLGTFRTVEEENAEDHHIHTEYYSVSEEVVHAVEETKAAGGRIIAVGTTSVRSLESAWSEQHGRLLPRTHEATSLFILPGYTFHVVDCMITNFHVPKSTLMMLVAAFSSTENIMAAYQHAINKRYRMLSFGDAMFMY